MLDGSEVAAQIAAAPEQLIARMGITITQYDADEVIGTMPVTGNRQPYGLLHGGASAVLAETLGSIAAVMYAGPERVAVGIELSCSHHRAARAGVVTGVCRPLHRGRQTASYDIVITDADGRRTCSARLTCSILAGPPGSALPNNGQTAHRLGALDTGAGCAATGSDSMRHGGRTR
ncbi:MAG: hotdog fold thioesterase [Mycobacteriales bacterium]